MQYKHLVVSYICDFCRENTAGHVQLSHMYGLSSPLTNANLKQHVHGCLASELYSVSSLHASAAEAFKNSSSTLLSCSMQLLFGRMFSAGFQVLTNHR